jgi:hypothetical protein
MLAVILSGGEYAVPFSLMALLVGVISAGTVAVLSIAMLVLVAYIDHRMGGKGFADTAWIFWFIIFPFNTLVGLIGGYVLALWWPL